MSAFDEEESLIRDYPFLLMGCLRLLLENNSTNAAMFRECGGARCVQNIVPYSTSRTEALKIIRELILSGGNDDLGKEMFCIPLPPRKFQFSWILCFSNFDFEHPLPPRNF